MTLLIGGIAVVLVTTMSLLGIGTAHVAEVKARAQTAADAAALAAVAESSFAGRNLQTFQARRFAELNGARLVDCVCDPGSTAVQVRVSLDGVEAEARAVVDPTAFYPLPGVGGLVPAMQTAVDRLLAAGGGRVTLVSGYRSTERQAELWNEALLRYGSPEAADDWVAPPGHSMHEKGVAVDLGGDVELAAALVVQLGLPLHRPLAHEPWHFELQGSRG